MDGKNIKYTAEDIEKMLWIPCCHVSGMHDPCHFSDRKYICGQFQLKEAFERFCKQIGINPQTKCREDCYWCNFGDKNTKEAKEHTKHNQEGAGLALFHEEKK